MRKGYKKNNNGYTIVGRFASGEIEMVVVDVFGKASCVMTMDDYVRIIK